MKLMSVSEASKKSGIPERTLYLKLEQNLLKNYSDNKTLLNYSEVLNLKPIVIVLYNLKGGIGKTTISAILSHYFGNIGKKVLACDLDPQQNLSICYEKFDSSKKNVYNFMDKFSIVDNKKNLLDSVVQNVNENIDLIPSSIELVSKHDIHIEDSSGLKEIFYEIFARYQIVIIDCPPNFTGLSKLGILLSNYIIMPVIAESFSYEGITLALSKMDDIIKFNPDFLGYKVILNRVKTRETSVKQLFEEKFRDRLKNKILHNSFPEFSLIDEVHATKENIFNIFKSKHQTEKIASVCKEINDYIYEATDE
ncbi:MAG: ParA family protein [Spirochaetes bacterium]|nr:ParA family protein [Spirochaetota bacterium]